MTAFTIERPIQFQRHQHGRKAMKTGSPSPVPPLGRVPRTVRALEHQAIETAQHPQDDPAKPL